MIDDDEDHPAKRPKYDAPPQASQGSDFTSRTTLGQCLQPRLGFEVSVQGPPSTRHPPHQRRQTNKHHAAPTIAGISIAQLGSIAKDRAIRDDFAKRRWESSLPSPSTSEDERTG
ncbi:hypothetical protein O9K51_10464 [Purpureocillium lavendulum]|uniref:Uncharacterized protein n=1 Tax=Purpureocillium lavendulum TaxID=1247861 RepID=A0AB34FCJ5_9HYPO|nr:hypothetical protein O9K51_10464 [Purpureocillium lavendulum]